MSELSYVINSVININFNKTNYTVHLNLLCLLLVNLIFYNQMYNCNYESIGRLNENSNRAIQ